MKFVIPIVTLIALAVQGASGLRCIGCIPNHQIAGFNLQGRLSQVTRGFPRCSRLNPKNPSLEFEMNCPSGMNSCVKIRDSRGNELRSCFPGSRAECSKNTKQGDVLCTCRGNLCNSADTSAPAIVSLFLPLVAALLRLH